MVEEGLRRMTPGQRIARAASLTVLAHGFALGQIRRQHPAENERQHQLRLAARYLDAETMAALGFIDDRSQ